jgi:hypothetical protein
MRRGFAIQLVCICLLAAASLMEAQDRTLKIATGLNEGSISLDFDGEQFLFESSIQAVELDPVISDPSYTAISIPGYFPSGDPGIPSLPGISRLFESPPSGEIRIRVEQIDSLMIDLRQLGIGEKILPYQPSPRKGEPNRPLMPDPGTCYTDGWIGGPLLDVEFEGTMRGLPISNLHFNPVQYNPSRGLLKVFYHVRCTIETPPPAGNRANLEPAFSGIFGRVVRQTTVPSKKAIFSEQPMTLVILSDPLFRDALQPLVRWKSRKGFRVVEAYLGDSVVGGTRESIKNYLKELYANPSDGVAPPSFLLIVGDVEQVPLSQPSGQITDLYYAEYDGGGDYIPELFYGRISVTTPEQLGVVVDKILEYEQYLFPDPAFLAQSVLIAGVDGSYAGTYGNGQINYANEYYLNSEKGITTHMFRYPESDTARQAILDLISDGVGFVNYTGHGLHNGWTDPAFGLGDIGDLKNGSRYPVMIGNGCETNIFSMPECFAEALLRAPGKGALAYIGCTNDSYWEEDYYWAVGIGPITAHPVFDATSPGCFDRVFHTHGEPYALWTPTLGEMIFGGNMAVQQSSSSKKKLYWEIYQLAGDPSIIPWFGRPENQEVDHPGLLPEGILRMDVTCAPYSYVAISKEGVLLDALHASAEGFATLRIPESISSGKLDLVITGDRYIPYNEELEFGSPEGPYLDLLAYHLTGESVEADSFITPGEMASLDLVLLNRGGEPIAGDTLVLFSGNAFLEVADSLVILEEMGPGDTLLLTGAFRFRSGTHVDDQARAVLGLNLRGTSSPLFLKEILHAPVLGSLGISWDDRSPGNGNGIAEEGEWLYGSWALFNSGHYRTGAVSGSWSGGQSDLIEQILFDTRPVLEPGDTAVLDFRLKVGSSGMQWFNSGPLLATDQYGSVRDSFQLAAGRYFEDFREGRTDRFPFENLSPVPWVTTQGSFASPMYALRSGKIGHKEKSEISLHFETIVGDSLSFSYRVSSESGYDFLRFYVDSIQAGSWSGNTGWDRYSLFMEPGPHEVAWSYTKDVALSGGEDAAWIDDIVFPESAFSRGDLSLVEILSPVSGPWLSDREQVRILVRNTSRDSVPGFTVHYSLNGVFFAEAVCPELLLPGEEVDFPLEHRLDLSISGTYRLGVQIVSDTLGFGGNNRLEKKIVRYDYPDLSLALEDLEEVKGVFTEATIILANPGNIPIGTVAFEVWLDERLRGSGTRFIGLDPGGRTEEVFRVADSLDNLPFGSHEFLIRAVLEDSVTGNNLVHGSFTWIPLGTLPSDQPVEWLFYPNPALSGFFVELRGPAKQEERFELIALTGRMVESFTLKTGTDRFRVSTSLLPGGNYLLRRVGTGETVRVVILR